MSLIVHSLTLTVASGSANGSGKVKKIGMGVGIALAVLVVLGGYLCVFIILKRRNLQMAQGRGNFFQVNKLLVIFV